LVFQNEKAIAIAPAPITNIKFELI
jgi:hypothetical protein